MKSLFYSAIILFMLLLMLPSCGKEHTAEEVLEVLLSSQENESMPPSLISYKMSAESHSKSYLSLNLKRTIYYGGRDDALCGEFDLLCDYALLLSNDDCPYEIHIFKLRYESDCDTIEKILKRRLEIIRSKQVYLYAPDDFEKYAAGATIFRKGNFVVLLAVEDSEKAIGAMEKFLN